MIDLAQVRREVGQIVDEVGEDYVYQSSDEGGGCYNVRFDQEHRKWVGDCLIGRWIVRFLKIDPNLLADNVRGSGLPGVLAHLCSREYLPGDFEISMGRLHAAR